MEGFVMDAVTGGPVVGMEVQALVEGDDDEELIKRTARSDREGRFVLKQIPDDGDCLVMAQRGHERAVARPWGSYESFEEEEPSEHVVLFTDRAIYRPGQVMHFKGIWCHVDNAKGDHRTLPDRKGAVMLTDPNGRETARIEVATNEKGFILTGNDIPTSDKKASTWTVDRDPHLLETSIPGIFAAGDVRAGVVRRVASAVGQGSIAISMIHKYLESV